MLTLHNLRVTINEAPLLKGVSITLFGGAWVNVFGSNGIGKSTLLKTIAGLRDVNKSTIMINGECITNDISMYYKDIAYMGHDLGLKELWTVNENLEFWAKKFGCEIIIPAVRRNCGLDDYMDVYANNLSMGNKKRLAFAIVVLSCKRVWLLDEPYSNLDDAGKELVTNTIAAHIANDGIVLMTSHTDQSMHNVINLDLKDYVY
ncbi:MAG: heme ABC exporter ATP-binding protein CcmA [Alphaproteobacteria bacterium]|jgi:heme exporter protein A|nr:heme ABC exporter ATP-binding protein CcmA [Candidatus Jidaibacter sp.]